tara:strand:- start:8648 stop:9316 length:669 start_codon:yes stop_codon:yes gene_type:complete
MYVARYISRSKIIKYIATGVTLAAIILISVPGMARAEKHLVLALGDSLTAGYGLPPGEGFPDQLEKKLAEKGMEVKVSNAGVSGDTSSGGLARLSWVLDSFGAEKPDLVILEFGANDALRGIDPRITRQNLSRMLEILKSRQIPVLFAGMLAPPNMGPDYAGDYNRIYPELAAEYDVAFYPFFLEGVAGKPQLNQEDGMHPNRQGVAVIVENILPYVLKNLR